jgi:hypothetical protein
MKLWNVAIFFFTNYSFIEIQFFVKILLVLVLKEGKIASNREMKPGDAISNILKGESSTRSSQLEESRNNADRL